jgi:hypothetical protein
MNSADIDGIDPSAEPSGTGCVECTAGDGPGWWFHLRRCAQCGHIGCCDSSPGRHGTGHATATGHFVLTSFEPGETWFWNVETAQLHKGPELAAPRWRPESQPGPGPAELVPADWERQLHR